MLVVACERFQGPPPRIVNGRPGIYLLPIETAILGAQNNHEWSVSPVRTHGVVSDKRPKTRIVAISLSTGVGTEDANRISRSYATSVFHDVIRFRIQTDYASDLSLNVDLFFFSIDAVDTSRDGCTATAGIAFVTASQLTY